MILKPPNTSTFSFRPHDSTETMWRVWNDAWGGDSFEVLTPEEFTQTVGVFARFSLPLRRASDD